MKTVDVDGHVIEPARAKNELGMKGAFVRPNACKGRVLHDTYFDPFWAAAAGAGMPIGLHPSGAGDLPGALQRLRLDARIMGHPSIFFIDNYIGFQCYISFDPDETTLPALTPVIGEERILWASDYPHLDATFPGVVRELEEHLTKLTDSAQDKVRGANAARLYGLEV